MSRQKPDYSTYLNIKLTLEYGGDLANALFYFKKYLEIVPQPDPQVVRKIYELRVLIVWLHALLILAANYVSIKEYDDRRVKKFIGALILIASLIIVFLAGYFYLANYTTFFNQVRELLGEIDQNVASKISWMFWH